MEKERDTIRSLSSEEMLLAHLHQTSFSDFSGDALFRSLLLSCTCLLCISTRERGKVALAAQSSHIQSLEMTDLNEAFGQ